MVSITIAAELVDLPGPRYRDQGKGSGEDFRERLLKPKFLKAREAGEQLLIELDGVEFGYPTSFLEEAFGGLAREYGIEAVQETLVFESREEPMLEEEIRRYIQSANDAPGPRP